jgi:hypothetical protein
MRTNIWIIAICIQVCFIGLLFRYTYAHNQLILKESINYLNKINQQYKIEKEIIQSSVSRSNFKAKNYKDDFHRALYFLELDKLIEQAKAADSKGDLLLLMQNLTERVSRLDPFYAKAELDFDFDSFSFHNTDMETLKSDFVNLVLVTKAYLFTPILFPHTDTFS